MGDVGQTTPVYLPFGASRGHVPRRTAPRGVQSCDGTNPAEDDVSDQAKSTARGPVQPKAWPKACSTPFGRQASKKRW